MLSYSSMVVCLRGLYNHTLSVSHTHTQIYIYIYIYPGKAGFFVFNYCAVLRCAHLIEYIMTLWSYTVIGAFTTSLSSLCRPIWRYWTAKMLVRYSVSNVCLRLGRFSQSSFRQHMGLCVFSLPISLMITVRILVLDLIFIIKLVVWPICHCLGLGHEQWYALYVFIYSCDTMVCKRNNYWN